MSRDQPLDAVGVGVGVEAAGADARGGAHRVAPGEHLEHRRGELVGLAGRDEAAGDAVLHDLGQSVDAGRDDRRPDRHRLGEHRTERLLV